MKSASSLAFIATLGLNSMSNWLRSIAHFINLPEHGVKNLPPRQVGEDDYRKIVLYYLGNKVWGVWMWSPMRMLPFLKANIVSLHPGVPCWHNTQQVFEFRLPQRLRRSWWPLRIRQGIERMGYRVSASWATVVRTGLSSDLGMLNLNNICLWFKAKCLNWTFSFNR